MLQVNIITPDKKVFEGEAVSASFPGSNGAFEVLNNHAPIVSSLEEGLVSVKDTSGTVSSFKISGGVVEVLNNNIAVLAESILPE